MLVNKLTGYDFEGGGVSWEGSEKKGGKPRQRFVRRLAFYCKPLNKMPSVIILEKSKVLPPKFPYDEGRQGDIISLSTPDNGGFKNGGFCFNRRNVRKIRFGSVE